MYNAVIPDSSYDKDKEPVKKGLGFGDFLGNMKQLKGNE